MQNKYIEVIAGALSILAAFLPGLHRPFTTIFGALLALFVISYLLAIALYFFLQNRLKYEKTKYVAVLVIAISMLSILGTLSQKDII